MKNALRSIANTSIFISIFIAVFWWASGGVLSRNTIPDTIEIISYEYKSHRKTSLEELEIKEYIVIGTDGNAVIDENEEAHKYKFSVELVEKLFKLASSQNKLESHLPSGNQYRGMYYAGDLFYFISYLKGRERLYSLAFLNSKMSQDFLYTIKPFLEEQIHLNLGDRTTSLEVSLDLVKVIKKCHNKFNLPEIKDPPPPAR